MQLWTITCSGYIQFNVKQPFTYYKYIIYDKVTTMTTANPTVHTKQVCLVRPMIEMGSGKSKQSPSSLRQLSVRIQKVRKWVRCENSDEHSVKGCTSC